MGGWWNASNKEGGVNVRSKARASPVNRPTVEGVLHGRVAPPRHLHLAGPEVREPLSPVGNGDVQIVGVLRLAVELNDLFVLIATALRHEMRGLRWKVIERTRKFSRFDVLMMAFDACRSNLFIYD